jgi:hypothetical protein
MSATSCTNSPIDQQPDSAACRCTVGLWVLLAAVIALQLVVLWSFEYFPSTDGPAHLANAAILRDYHQPQGQVYRHYYTLAEHIDPNLAGHLLLTGLMRVVSPLHAEKILLSLYVLGLPLAGAYAMAAARRGSGAMAVLLTPLSFNYVLHMGFYNFCLSLAVFFIVIGYWLRYRQTMTWWRAGIFGLLMLLLYCCHLLALVLAAGTIALLATWALLRDWSQSLSNRLWWQRFWRQEMVTLLAALPALLLAARFLRRHRERRIPADSGWTLLTDLLSLDTLVSFDERELWLTRALAAVFGAAVLWVLLTRLRRRRLESTDVLLLPPIAYLALYFLAGMQSFLSWRLSLMFLLGLVLWLGVQLWPRGLRWTLSSAAAIIAIALLSMHARAYAQLQHPLRQYVEVASRVPPGATLLALPFERRHGRIDSFMYASGYVVAHRPLIDLRNYEAHLRYFPVDYRPQRDPYRHLVRRWIHLEGWPTPVNLNGFPPDSQASVDYVMLWGRPSALVGNQAAPELFAQLHSDFELVHATEQSQLWRRRSLP